MPTRREREYYRMGYEDGARSMVPQREAWRIPESTLETFPIDIPTKRKPKRKLSAWNKYVKNKRNHIRYRDGKLNLKKMAVAFRRKKRR